MSAVNLEILTVLFFSMSKQVSQKFKGFRAERAGVFHGLTLPYFETNEYLPLNLRARVLIEQLRMSLQTLHFL